MIFNLKYLINFRASFSNKFHWISVSKRSTMFLATVAINSARTRVSGD